MGVGDIRVASEVEIPIESTIKMNAQIDFDKSEIVSYKWEMQGEDSDCVYVFPMGDCCLIYARYKITEEARIRLVATRSNGTAEYSEWCELKTK